MNSESFRTQSGFFGVLGVACELVLIHIAKYKHDWINICILGECVIYFLLL